MIPQLIRKSRHLTFFLLLVSLLGLTLLPLYSTHETVSSAAPLAKPLNEIVNELPEADKSSTLQGADETIYLPIVLDGEPTDPIDGLVTIIRSSPLNGEDDVAVTRETIIEFSDPIDPDSVSDAVISAQFGGQRLAKRLHISPDNRTVTLFYNQPLPASARVRVTIDGQQLLDANGDPVDVDGDGSAGGTTTIDFDTLSLTVIEGTSVCGRVFASELDTNDRGTSVNVPLQGVTITVDGMEDTLRTTTDSKGNFCLDPAPAGRFFVHIDGRTATNGVPEGTYYPFVGKAWESTIGQQTNVGTAHLPLVPNGTLQPVSQTEDTTINLAPTVLEQFPEFADVSITVPANSLYADNGTRGGSVGIAPVPPDRLPGQLPEELNFPVVITVQTDGATNFDTPAPVCFPNLPDPDTGETLAAGEKSALFSFNHDTGRWEIAGSMTVSQDGTLICADEGVGVRAPGWHGTQPGSQGSGPSSPGGGGGGGGDGTPTPASTPNPTSTPNPSTTPNPTSTPDPSPTPSPSPTQCPEVTYPDPIKIGTETASCVKDIFKLGPILDLIIDKAKSTKDLYDQIKQVKADYESGNIDEARVRSIVASIQFLSNQIKATVNPLLEQTSGRIKAVITCIKSGVSLMDSVCDTIEDIPDECLNFAEEYILKPYCESGIHDYLKIGLDFAVLSLDQLQDAIAMLVFDSIDSIANQILSYIDSQYATQSPHFHSSQGPDPVLVEMLGELVSVAEPLNISSEVTDNAENTLATLSTYSAMIGDFYITNESPIPNAYILVEYNDFLQRIRATEAGIYRVFLPAETPFSLSLFDPVTGHCGTFGGYSSQAGESTILHGPAIGVCDSTDTDDDNLSDFAENIIGTNPEINDTDGDGIDDGAEIEQGTDPLDGLIVQTGIIASADTPGTAVDVCVTEDTAVVADSGAGISVFNVFNGMNPSIIAQVDTQGNAQAVACAGNLIAVADGEAGLAVVDITDPPAAQIIHQIRRADLGGNGRAVVVAGGFAYVGTTNGTIAAVELSTGVVSGQIDLALGIQDVAIEGETLYALTEGTLHTLSFLDGSMQLLASVETPGGVNRANGRMRLFVGGGVAYPVHRKGYNTIDVSNPSSPTLITTTDTDQFGWKQIALNGSGLGVAAVSPNQSFDGPHHISLYDTSDPTVTDAFLTQFETPGVARSVSIFNGLAYVADHNAGLQVINYLAYDAQGVEPTLTLASNYAPGVAEEDALMRVTANATDDVQVRHVEFDIDGVQQFTDGSFPFEYRFTTPRIAEQSTFILTVRAIDTGGNETEVEQLITLQPDATAPRVTVVMPSMNSIAEAGALDTISVTFNEAIDSATLTEATFELFTFGPDGIPANGDDVPVTGGTISYDADTLTASLNFSSALPADRYRAVVAPPLADLAGNPLGAELAWTFELAPFIQIGDVVSGEISFAGEIDTYFFSAEAGQQVFFDVQNQSAISQVNWQLVDRTGTVVFDTCLGCGDPGVHTLTQGGTYTLIVREGGNNQTGTYQLQLWNVPPSDEFTINIDDLVSDGNPAAGAGNIETPGVKDIYTFNATAGQQVFFDLQEHSGMTQIDWQVVDQDGTVIFDTCLGCGDPGVHTLTRGGTYTLTVGDDRDDRFGTYQFQLWNVPPADEFAINIGDVVSDGNPAAGAGNIETPGVKDIYTFNASAGQQVFFDQQGHSGISQVDWQVVDEDGTVILDTCLGCGEPGIRTLTRGGTYILTVGDDRDDGFGTYQFQLWNVPAADEFAINIGDVVSDGNPAAGAGNIESPGVKDIYTFNASAGQQVFFDQQGHSGISQVDWQVVDEDGTVIFNTCLGCGDPGVQTLTRGGRYTLTVGDDRDDGFGTYSFQIIDQSQVRMENSLVPISR